MNIHSHRRLLIESELRSRIRDRIQAARERAGLIDAEEFSASSAPVPGDDCTCVACTLRRSIGLPREAMDPRNLRMREFKVADGESMSDALRRAADEMVQELDGTDNSKAKH